MLTYTTVTLDQDVSEVAWQNPSFPTTAKMDVSHVADPVPNGSTAAKMAASHMSFKITYVQTFNYQTWCFEF